MRSASTPSRGRVARQASRWATNADWDRKRHIITELYRDQNRRLVEVMAIMAQEHDFKATTRMYKKRFLKWGIGKKLREEHLLQILIILGSFRNRSKDCAGEKLVFFLNGRRIEDDRLRRSISRNPQVVERYHAGVIPSKDSVEAVTHQAIMPSKETPSPNRNSQIEAPKSDTKTKTNLVTRDIETRGRAISPLSTQLELPVSLYNHEKALHAVAIYTRKCFEVKWDIFSGDYSHKPSVDWWADMHLAAGRIKERPNSAASFELRTSQRMLRSLSKVGEDLAMLFMRYAVGICQIDLGPGHPFTNFCETLSTMDLDEARQACFRILSTQYEVMQSFVELTNPFWFVSTLLLHRTLRSAGAIENSKTVELLADETINKTSKAIAPENINGRYLLLRARMFTVSLRDEDSFSSSILPTSNRTGAAVHLLEEWHRETSLHKTNNEQIDLMATIGATEESKGKFRSAEEYYKGALKVAISQTPRGHPRILSALSSLERYYRRRGEAEAAERTQQAYQDECTWECIQADNVH
ncbi:hypothetical protein SUNI508_12767 [Seiridium unicorne]|uniref:Clr5 domain-containing protein n=1 Tax=Seiridium unicorne TaxID=138068 RepID=A0ABR2VHJ3_9PEZI